MESSPDEQQITAAEHAAKPGKPRRRATLAELIALVSALVIIGVVASRAVGWLHNPDIFWSWVVVGKLGGIYWIVSHTAHRTEAAARAELARLRAENAESERRIIAAITHTREQALAAVHTTADEVLARVVELARYDELLAADLHRVDTDLRSVAQDVGGLARYHVPRLAGRMERTEAEISALRRDQDATAIMVRGVGVLRTEFDDFRDQITRDLLPVLNPNVVDLDTVRRLASLSQRLTDPDH